MENSDVVLRLSAEEAMTLTDLLEMIRFVCEDEMSSSRLLLNRYAYRLVNSAIDPIIAQLEVELETLGVN